MNVTFTNSGLIPIEAITTLGINVKETDNPIGFFGTGLKYAIASILRTGQKITIWRGLERFSFELRAGEVRGKSFDFIFMNGERLGFTVDLGKTWEMWQVFRELYSNCLDEDGKMEFGLPSPAEGRTSIHVRGNEFTSIAYKKDEIFLSTKPIYEDYYCDIHEGKSNVIYYRGVRVLTLEKPSQFTYNLKLEVRLTEDRTLSSEYTARSWVSYAISSCKNLDIFKKAITNSSSFEWDFSYSTLTEECSQKVMELVYSEGAHSIAPNAVLSAEDFLKKKIAFKLALITSYEQRQLDSAVSFLKEIGFDVTQEIRVATNLGEGICGQARDGVIWLAKSTLDKGGNWLIGTILEEHLHLERGFVDESREFQNFLLDLAIKFAKESLGRDNV